MIGFTPGWSYLSGLDKSLHMSRRQNPRLLTPAGTISIGGIQAGIQCLAGPSGWHLLGRTAVRTYQLHRDPIFLLEPGDNVTFAPSMPRPSRNRIAPPKPANSLPSRSPHEQTRHCIDRPGKLGQDGGRPAPSATAWCRAGRWIGWRWRRATRWSAMNRSRQPSKSARSAPSFTARGGAVRVALAGARAMPTSPAAPWHRITRRRWPTARR
jgi:hypothetical protein